MVKHKTVIKTRMVHRCIRCSSLIEEGSACTYSAVTNTDAVAKGNIIGGYICTGCRDVSLNEETKV